MVQLSCPAQERTATKDDRRMVLNPDKSRYYISNEISGIVESVAEGNSDNQNADREIFDLIQMRQAAERGDAKAQYSLGVAYFKGEGVQKNYTEAVKWSLKAAEQGLSLIHI